MKRKNKTGEPRPSQVEPAEYRHKQERQQDMTKDGDEVIRERPAIPNSVFHPKKSMKHRIVLRRGGRVGPNSGQASDGPQLWPGEVDFVVPNRLPIPGRPVNDDRDEEKS